jgi:aspartate/methionine/tyrosine aminotransferase
VIAAMATIQGQSTSNASSISQKAATVALNAPQDCVGEMNLAFKARHDLVVEGLNALPGVHVIAGWGTFYAFANVEQAMKNVGSLTTMLSPSLINEAGVAIVPGFFRRAYAALFRGFRGNAQGRPRAHATGAFGRAHAKARLNGDNSRKSLRFC